ncbi:uncharacterized protein LOC118747812 [Rhagoletis pomonella]|uniref:uncharacterized protein LOC118747812 n=1 Tax=Rhagoletis pomonella TaxID=28610 RepID=UPI0017839009|nr:uncharacterized protein LOC118747812 [Rhagoletis pomonella]XP_036337866.1 uncharacterized protein LOC118747812 [Rhagoletis pomonella]XP_036337867.1 uncharacterized protein LOC118747812 [Rhagoletis pomonella]XP_036337868.1 uncharacterized protein LOC118747812 [Rhagoletis pomonella]XP_036337869.1 uncharacterized protein LOC118747812 [Rhagoletis pomonella]XP_036337870.1 uncharacterized protein LOC118747812 [Rhagoletis pomonella]XP_036337871.1 uncharacterized protein LOC118747812 [Rhagoletis p
MSAILYTQDSEQEHHKTHELQLDKDTFENDSCNGISDEQLSGHNDGSAVSLELPSSIPSTSSTERHLNDSLKLTHPMSTQLESDCDALLESKMAALDLHEGGSSHCDGGSDSGLDTATTKSAMTGVVGGDSNSNSNSNSNDSSSATKNISLQRALSSNSGGYASSSGGLDEVIHQTTALTMTSTAVVQGLNLSGNSSLLSCGSDAVSAELATSIATYGAVSSATQSFECYSENGSESSSMLGGATVATTPVRRSNSVKTKVRVFESSRGGFATPMSRSMRERDCSSTPISTNSTSSSAYLHTGSATTPRARPVGVKRTSSLSRHVPATAATSAQRQTDKQPLTTSGTSNYNSKTLMAAPTSTLRSSTARTTKPQKPDSLPNALSRTQSMSMQRLVQRTPSLSRARTPCTPSEDGRWPGNTTRTSSVGVGAAKRGVSVTPDLMSLKMRSSNMMASMEVKSSTSSNANSNPYSTLPRRRKQKSVEDLTAAHESRSSSITRDARMTTSVMAGTRRNLVSAFGASTPQSNQARSLMHTRKTPAQPPKTRIYHETSVQTALTGEDLENVFAGREAATRAIDAVDQQEQTTQTDMRDAELERLRDEVRQLAQREHELSVKLQHEREEKLATQRELHLNTERVMSMLEMARIAGRRCGRTGGSVSGISLDGDATTPTSDEGSGSGHDSLLMLESQIQISGHELIERQHEIGQLRQLCRTLQLEMERSLAAQECLLQEKAAIEQESSELQDFLQHEKTTLHDALKELEHEHQACKQQLAGREEEVKVLRDECRHLVRLNEQRRQENRMLQSKYAALENKSKEMMMQQNYSVSGASAALSGLHSRLDSLVEQLVSTYNITEHDLEDIGFQPEVQQNQSNALEMRSSQNIDECHGRLQSHANTNGLELCTHSQQFLPQSSDGSLSPQRNQSFIAAVISAIRNATTPSSKKLLTRNGKRISSIDNAVGGGGGVGDPHPQGTNKSNNNANYNNYNGDTQNGAGDDSDSTEMLDSETEPCLMMDNVLEDVTMPDSHSHNMVSSCNGIISQLEIPTELVNPASGDESLHNLSQAIVNRQQMELQISAMQSVQKAALQLNQCELENSDEASCHDSVAEMPSLMEYCTAQAVVDQVIEVDSLVTKLLKVLRLIQMDNDSCIQQLIVDKNKLQENKEDMLEKLKDLQDVNIKLQDELMDATQELLLKNNDLSNTKAEMQRHRNEIDVRF